jgi:arsenate reductase (glutaredoxin)
MLTVYGINQCDTCRKALKWLSAQSIEHQFHDFRVDGLDETLLRSWLNSSFADKLINRRSTSWRQLNDQQREVQGDAQVLLLLEHPTLIKRPVFVNGDIIAIGFKPQELSALLS